ncbi:hypothetical protein BVX98_01685 [bacterium F11]|nr:hypothetical protein BVX98_01685 [bacterium F11]
MVYQIKPFKNLKSHEKIQALEALLTFLPNEIPTDSVLPLLQDPERKVRSLSAKVLVRARHTGIFSYLIQLIRDKDPETRILGVTLLSDTRNKAAALPLLDLLNDKNSAVQSQTVLTLVSLGTECLGLAAKRVESLNLTDRALIMRSLSALSFGGEEILAQGLKDEEVWVRTEAVKALANKKNETSTSLLLTILKDPYPLIRLEAVHALAGRKDVRIKSAISPLLQDPNLDVAAAVSKLMNNF